MAKSATEPLDACAVRKRWLKARGYSRGQGVIAEKMAFSELVDAAVVLGVSPEDSPTAMRVCQRALLELQDSAAEAWERR